MNPHGSIKISLGRNQALAAMAVLSRGLDEISSEIEDVPDRKQMHSDADTVHAKIRNAARDQGWLDGPPE